MPDVGHPDEGRAVPCGDRRRDVPFAHRRGDDGVREAVDEHLGDSERKVAQRRGETQVPGARFGVGAEEADDGGVRGDAVEIDGTRERHRSTQPDAHRTARGVRAEARSAPRPQCELPTRGVAARDDRSQVDPAGVTCVRERVDRPSDVFERGGHAPAPSAPSDPPVLDVPDREPRPHEGARQRRHRHPCVRRPPEPAVDEHDHRHRTIGVPGQPERTDLLAVRSVPDSPRHRRTVPPERAVSGRSPEGTLPGVPPHDLVGPFPAGANPDEYDQLRRRVFWEMPSGIYLVGSRAGERRNLMTCTWVTQVAREPKLVGVAVEREALTHELIARGRAFAISLVERSDRAVVRKFVKPAVVTDDGRTLNGVSCTDAPSTGSPVLAGARGFLDCRLERAVELGSHTFFIGEVVDAGLVPPAGEHAPPTAPGEGVLRMEDTRMNYGG